MKRATREKHVESTAEGDGTHFHVEVDTELIYMLNWNMLNSCFEKFRHNVLIYSKFNFSFVMYLHDK